MSRIGLICAMESEMSNIISALENPASQHYAGCDFYTGHIGQYDIVLAKCGVGKVNAARCTQIMIDRYDITLMINSGIAGSIAPGPAIGDVVIATDLVQHDFDTTPVGYVRGYIPGNGDGTKPTFYAADESLSQKLADAASGNNIHFGRIASGDQFIGDLNDKLDIADTFCAIAVEMEGAAVAQTASSSGIPFAVLRVISDLADGNEHDYTPELEKKYAGLSADVVINFLKGH